MVSKKLLAIPILVLLAVPIAFSINNSSGSKDVFPAYEDRIFISCITLGVRTVKRK